jgi:KTSC domain
MNMKPVSASNVHAIGYDPATKDMAIQFHKNGVPTPGTYTHHDVPPEVHAALMDAESHGKHYAANIKGKVKHTKADAA